MTTVALDALGADAGAGPILGGARAAAADGIRLRVFGRTAELGELTGVDGVELVEAPEEISNHDDPLPAVRSRPDASVVAATADVAEGNSQALVSAGSTGATMAAATLGLRRMRGVHRPALAVELRSPSRPGRPLLLLDVGAGTEAPARHLVQFAHLGSAFSRAVLGVERPRVALLSVGEESTKGTPAVIEAHEALAAGGNVTLAEPAAGDGPDAKPTGSAGPPAGPPFEFAGNVEGRDLLDAAADVDVVVTDGFTGNVTLKTIEGTAKAVAMAVRDAARSNPFAAAGGLLLRPALAGLRHELDPDATGGAVLLGLRRVAVVTHGSSGPDGIANAIRLADRAVRERAIERTAEQLEASGATRGRLRDPAGADA